MKTFFAEYQSRAAAEGVDPLGYYLGAWGYAYLEVLADAVNGTKSIDDNKLAEYLHSHTMPTIMGDIKYDKDGEWAKFAHAAGAVPRHQAGRGPRCLEGHELPDRADPGRPQGRRRDLSYAKAKG